MKARRTEYPGIKGIVIDERTFPILPEILPAKRRLLEKLGCPRSVPWSLVEPHEQQAVKNHDQTLARLAQRGGLSPAELVWVLDGKGLMSDPVEDEDAVPRLLEILAERFGVSDG